MDIEKQCGDCEQFSNPDGFTSTDLAYILQILYKTRHSDHPNIAINPLIEKTVLVAAFGGVKIGYRTCSARLINRLRVATGNEICLRPGEFITNK